MLKTNQIFCGTNATLNKIYCTICDDETNVIDKDFYVNLDTVNINEFVKVIDKNRFANKMPIKNENIGRFVTYIKITKGNAEKIEKSIKDLVNTNHKENEPYTYGDFTNFMICSALINVAKDIDGDDTSIVYLQIFDNVVGGSFIGLYPVTENEDLKNNIPFFTASSLAETFSKEDYQLNFSTKVTGITAASFVTRPITFDNIYLEPVAGSHFTVNNDGIKISYLGTEFTKEKFEDLTNLKVLLDLEFEPINGKLYKTKSEFDTFNNFVNYVKSSTDFNTSTKFGFKLSKISVKCEGSKSEEFGKSERIISRINAILQTYCPGITFDDISTNDKTTTEIVNNNEFDLKVVVDVFSNIV
jgi:hypothetical protein